MEEELSEDMVNERANEKRRKHKAAKDRLLASKTKKGGLLVCLLYTSPSPRDQRGSRMPSSA